MFDQSGGKAGILSYPPLVMQEFSACYSPDWTKLLFPHSLDLTDKVSFEKMKKSLVSSPAEAGLDGRQSACVESMVCTRTSAALASNTIAGFYLPSRIQILSTVPEVTSVLHVASENEGVQILSSQAHGGVAHREANDLEALVECCNQGENSIESASTKFIHHFSFTPPNSCAPSLTRKRVAEELAEQEVDSRFTKLQRFADSILDEFSSPEESMVGTASGESPQLSDGRNCDDDCCLDQSAHELQMLCDDFCFEMPEQQRSVCSEEGDGEAVSSGSARESRRQKIKATVKLLRDVIPGGGCIDTAIVLDEAIHYVKLLQLQVQTLGAKRLAETAAR